MGKLQSQIISLFSSRMHLYGRSVIVLGSNSYQSLGKDNQPSDTIVNRMNNRPSGLEGNIYQ